MKKNNKTSSPSLPPTTSLPPTGGAGEGPGEGPAEIWRTIPGFPRYEVSNKGRVRSNCCKNGRKVRYVMKAYLRSDGYFCVDLSISGRKSRKVMAVHRLVARAFIGECPPGKVCDHKSGDLSDNRVENLRYASLSENQANKHIQRFKDGFRIEVFRDGVFIEEVTSRKRLLEVVGNKTHQEKGGFCLNSLFNNGRTWRYKNFYAVLVLPSDEVEPGPAPHVQFRLEI